MGIKRKRPTDLKPPPIVIEVDGKTKPASKEFTDRIEPRKAFWNLYQQLFKEEDSLVITFYGAGGVGKTALLDKLEEEIKNRESTLANTKCVYVRYDFNRSTNLLEILKTFKFQLAYYGCNFPLFDTGSYYYELKTGQDITPPKAKSMMEKIPWLNKIRNDVTKADKYMDKAAPLLNTGKMFFDMTDEVLQAIPITKAIAICFSIVDKLLITYMAETQVFDADHQKLRHNLNAHCQNRNPIAIYEYLPALFAQDVADWLKATGNKLVVLLDNYELLISETSLATEEQLKRDLWLRGDEGLIFGIPNTLWAIAGRNKLRWGGELADELDQHLIKALSPEDSEWFLWRAGVKSENLRKELVQLTEGYPIFLDLCVDVYREYKRRHNAEPTIDEFGQKRQDVVARIFRYFDADKDDAAKDMLEYLCVLNVWTDDIAQEIGAQVLYNFSHNTYKRVKEFSFIQEERIQNDDIDLTTYRFDRTIQSILFAECDKKLVEKVKTATEKYFQEFFENTIPSNPVYFFCLRMWSEFVIRFAVDSEELWEQYDDRVNRSIWGLRKPDEFDSVAEIINLFMVKVESFGDADSIPYAHFELELASIKDAQKKLSDVYKLRTSAYEKFIRILGEDDLDTLSAMKALAMTLKEFGHYNEALTLQEKVLAGFKKILGEKDEDGKTFREMDAVANTLYVLGRYEDAWALQEKVFSLRKEVSKEDDEEDFYILLDMYNTLSALGRCDEALALQEKILTLHKEFLGEDTLNTLLEKHRLRETLDPFEEFELGFEIDEIREHMKAFANALITFGRYKEALDWQEKILVANKEILGEEAPDTVKAMNELANTLSALGRYDEALTLQKKVLAAALEGPVLWSLREFLGDAQPDAPTAMNNLANTLSKLGRHEEALKLREKVLAGFEELLGKNHPSTIESMERLAETLDACGKRESALKMIEDALAIAQKIFGEDNPQTADIKTLRDKILNDTV